MVTSTIKPSTTFYISPCAICGEAIPAEDLPPAVIVNDEYQEHFYDPWSGGTVCYCGAVKEDDCEHLYISERYEEVGYKAGATQLDENQHLREIEYITVDQICDSSARTWAIITTMATAARAQPKKRTPWSKPKTAWNAAFAAMQKNAPMQIPFCSTRWSNMDYVKNGGKYDYKNLGNGKHSYKQWLNEVIQCQDCGLIYAGDAYISTGTEDTQHGSDG